MSMLKQTAKGSEQPWVAQTPLCSLQIPTPWGWRGYGHHSVLISLCHRLCSSLPEDGAEVCKINNHTSSENPGPLCGLASYMAHFKPFLQDPGEAAGFSQVEKDLPQQALSCSLYHNRAARPGLRSSHRHLGFTCYKEAAIPHLQNLHKPLRDY